MDDASMLQIIKNLNSHDKRCKKRIVHDGRSLRATIPFSYFFSASPSWKACPTTGPMVRYVLVLMSKMIG